MKTAATFALSAAGLVLLVALGSGCSSAPNANDPNSKKNAMTMKPSAGAGGPGGGTTTAGGRPGTEGAAGAGVKE